MKLALIVAVAENGAIGHQGKLPWHLSADLRRFKRLTMDHAIVMGRKTWESIGKPLPGRTSIVISRQADYQAGFSQVIVVSTMEEALAEARAADCDPDPVFVIGGAGIFESTLPQAERMYFTRVLAEVPGDVFFPPIDWQDWELKEQSRHQADEENDYPFVFEMYERVKR